MSTDTLTQWAQRMEFGPIRTEVIQITKNIEAVSIELGISTLSGSLRSQFKALQATSFTPKPPALTITSFRVSNHNSRSLSRYLGHRKSKPSTMRHVNVPKIAAVTTAARTLSASSHIWGPVRTLLLTKNSQRFPTASNTVNAQVQDHPVSIASVTSVKKQRQKPPSRTQTIQQPIVTQSLGSKAHHTTHSVSPTREGGSAETQITEEQLKKPNVLIVGDSLMGGVGPRLKRLLRKEHGFPNPKLKWKASTGLSRPDYFDWPKTLNTLLSEKKYDVVVAIFGTNDTQPVSVNRKSYRYGTKSWFEHYRKRVVNVLDMMCKAQNRSVYWIGLPTMRSESFNEKIVKMNALYREELARSTCGKYIPMDKILSPDGQFSSYLRVGKKRKKVRAGDGIHLSFTGYDYVARRVIDTILAQTEPKVLQGTLPLPALERSL